MSDADASASDERRPRRGPRRLAEWLTFGLSSLLVLALAGHLAWRMREPAGDVAFARVSLRIDQVEERGGRYLLPIELQNPSRRTLRDVQIRIHRPGANAQRSDIDVLVDYLGQSSSQTIYVYCSDDPRRQPMDAEAVSYRVD